MESNELWGKLFPRLKAYIDDGLPPSFVAEFCNVSPSTVKTWLRGGGKPAGDAAIRLWYLLQSLGADSPELNKLDPFVRVVGELFAFGLLTAEDVVERSGFTGGKLSRAYVMMRGQPPLRPRDTVEELTEIYRDELAQRRQATLAMVSGSVSDSSEHTRPIREPDTGPTAGAPANPVPALPQTGPQSVSIGSNASLTLASLLGAAAPLARNLNNAGTPEQRSDFRDLIGTENLFDLSNILSALCSERARGLAR